MPVSTFTNASIVKPRLNRNRATVVFSAAMAQTHVRRYKWIDLVVSIEQLSRDLQLPDHFSGKAIGVYTISINDCSL